MLSGIFFMVVLLVLWLLWIYLYITNLMQTTLKIFFVGFFILAFLVVASAFIVGIASAAENPTTIEKPTAACPTEFNPDDSTWALRQIIITPIDAFSREPVVDDAVLMLSHLYYEHVRVLRYMGNWNCVANLYSYGTLQDADGKRVWGLISLASEIGKKTFFLFLDNDSPVNPKTLLRSQPDVWQSGDYMEDAIDCDAAMHCKLSFFLYKDKVQIALRAVDVTALRVTDINHR